MACPLCAQANETDENRPKAYMYSILFMMSMPAVIFTGFSVGLYRLHKKHAAQETQRSVLGGVNPHGLRELSSAANRLREVGPRFEDLLFERRTAMRITTHFSLAVVGALLASGAWLAAQAKEEKGDGQKIKPAPGVPAQSAFELKVETKPRFPKENRPAASVPSEVKSLSVTIQPEKKAFAGNGPLSFLVTLENKSKAAVLVYGLEHLGASPKLVISNLTNANQWPISGDFTKAKDQPAIRLGAGESKTYTLVVEANWCFPGPCRCLVLCRCRCPL